MKLLPTILGALMVCSSALAQAQSSAIDARTFDQLSKAQQLAAEGKHDDALYVLDRLKQRTRLNGYATAQLWNFYAFIYASRDEYDQAIHAYKQVLAQPEAPEGLLLTAKYTIGQLYFQLERYDACIRFIEDWLQRADKPTATAHIMLAQAYYQKQAGDSALQHVDTAIALQQDEGKPVQESWLRMKAILHYSQQDYAATAQAYENLIEHYPKLDYMRQLAGMYSELGEDKKRLAVFDAVYEYGGLKSEDELLNLAYMWLAESVPYKAGRIIETHMADGGITDTPKNIETLANAWAQANQFNKAVPSLRRAAELSNDGVFFARLAGVHFNAGDYNSAIETALLADEKGDLNNPAGNLMLLGMAYFNLKDYENALQAFRRARQDKKTYAAASKWQDYTLKEISRLRALQKSQQDLFWRTHQALEATENNQEAISISH